jgi:hypothetical protein
LRFGYSTDVSVTANSITHMIYIKLFGNGPSKIQFIVTALTVLICTIYQSQHAFFTDLLSLRSESTSLVCSLMHISFSVILSKPQQQSNKIQTESTVTLIDYRLIKLLTQHGLAMVNQKILHFPHHTPALGESEYLFNNVISEFKNIRFIIPKQAD